MKHHLKIHFETVHDGKNNHQCSICPSKFSREDQRLLIEMIKSKSFSLHKTEVDDYFLVKPTLAGIFLQKLINVRSLISPCWLEKNL